MQHEWNEKVENCNLSGIITGGTIDEEKNITGTYYINTVKHAMHNAAIRCYHQYG